MTKQPYNFFGTLKRQNYLKLPAPCNSAKHSFLATYIFNFSDSSECNRPDFQRRSSLSETPFYATKMAYIRRSSFFVGNRRTTNELHGDNSDVVILTESENRHEMIFCFVTHRFSLQIGQITLIEADSILLTVYRVNEEIDDECVPPSKITSNELMVMSLYTRLHTWVSLCFGLVGMTKFIV